MEYGPIIFQVSCRQKKIHANMSPRLLGELLPGQRALGPGVLLRNLRVRALRLHHLGNSVGGFGLRWLERAWVGLDTTRLLVGSEFQQNDRLLFVGWLLAVRLFVVLLYKIGFTAKQPPVSGDHAYPIASLKMDGAPPQERVASHSVFNCGQQGGAMITKHVRPSRQQTNTRGRKCLHYNNSTKDHRSSLTSGKSESSRPSTI